MAQRKPLPPITKRLRAVKVGDLIQYFYEWGAVGFKHRSLTTRAVIEVIDDGAGFVVEGGFRVKAGDVQSHIPMHEERDGR